MLTARSSRIVMVTLENTHLSLVLSEHGAEPCSLKNKHTGIEYIWNADPTYWQRHAPILFPMSGPTKDGKITVGGTVYDLPNNGFARDSEYTVAEKTADSARFVLEENEKTLAMYPFGFRLTIEYSLKDEGITIKATVESKSDGMAFVYALHPAFMLSMNEGATMENYMILFSDEEKQDKDSLQSKKFVTTTDGLVGKVLPLSREELDKGPIVLHSVKSKKVSLSCNKGNHGVEITMGELHTLVCWSPEGKKAPFVCVEPMYSFGDSDRPQELSQMPGVIKMNKGQKKSFTNSFRVY